MKTRSRSARAAEVEGFLIGIDRRLQAESTPEGPDPTAARLAAEGRAAAATGDWARAEALLEAAGAQLDALRPEPRLREWPRGLVEYVPTGRPEAESTTEEDPLFNRLLLVQRLLGVRAAEGFRGAGVVETLRAAEAAYRAGDRPRARRLVDEAHAVLDADVRRKASPTE